MPTNWDDIIKKASRTSKDNFSNLVSSLVNLTSKDIEELLEEPGIDKENLAQVLKVVQDAAKSNEEKAATISKISNGLQIVVGLAVKLLL